MISKLVARLQASKRYRDAAHLAEYHLQDYQLSGQCLTDGLFFSEAWALTHKYNMGEWAGKSSLLFHI